jgi:serine/threonine-protein kinase RsbW
MKKNNSRDSNGNKFHLKLPAKSENLDIIRKFVASIAENNGFNDDEIYQIELAVDEACANVVRHAYRGLNVAHPEILVTVRTHKNGIEISIVDRGKGFDPDKLPTPDMDEYLKKMKPGGLGVHLIKSLMDKVTFSIKPGVRNEVKMVKIHNNG